MLRFIKLSVVCIVMGECSYRKGTRYTRRVYAFCIEQ